MVWTSIGAIIILILIFGSMFIVDETEQALIIYLGKPTSVVLGDQGTNNIEDVRSRFVETLDAENTLSVKAGAGLYFKIPFLESVVKMDDRLMEYDAAPTDIVTKDKKHLLVDNFLRWRIVDPLLFYQSVRTSSNARSRLDDIMFSTLREILANNNLIEVVRSTNRELQSGDKTDIERVVVGRSKIMEEVTQKVQAKALVLGILVQDVRIKRADLPKENENAVFSRMRAERQRISKQYRSEGEEAAQRIRSETDRDVEIILADAYKEAETIRGKADAEATRIYAEAYQNYSDFYAFSKSLETLEKSIDARTKIIIGIDSGLFRVLKGETPR